MSPRAHPRVRTFFYGSYMNRAVLGEVRILPERLEVCRLDGYDISIAPRATLIPSTQHSVYGVVAELSHPELERLYSHARQVLGETYLPHPVLVQTLTGGWWPVLCYLAPSMSPRRPDPVYLERIVAPARQFNFPTWYISRLIAAGGELGEPIH